MRSRAKAPLVCVCGREKQKASCPRDCGFAWAMVVAAAGGSQGRRHEGVERPPGKWRPAPALCGQQGCRARSGRHGAAFAFCPASPPATTCKQDAICWPGAKAERNRPRLDVSQVRGWSRLFAASLLSVPQDFPPKGETLAFQCSCIPVVLLHQLSPWGRTGALGPRRLAAGAA